MASVVNSQKRPARTMYVALILALVSLVGVFVSDGVLVFLLPSILIYFMWGMNERIKELEKRLDQQPQAADAKQP